jgi:rhodanese-related sulfurtransferase
MFARLMGLNTISPRELRDATGVMIFDVNSRQSWLAARVPGALHFDGDADLPAEKSAALVFYCSNPLCRKAPNAAKRAKTLGYDNVRVMSAGITGWVRAGFADAIRPLAPPSSRA